MILVTGAATVWIVCQFRYQSPSSVAISAAMAACRSSD